MVLAGVADGVKTKAKADDKDDDEDEGKASVSNPKILVVFYSRTGMVRRVADVIAEELSADLEEIIDTRNRRGPFGLLSAARAAVLRRGALIVAPRHDPADYDLVVIGTPVWAWSVSAPARAYLALQRGRLPEVAFFAVARRLGAGRTLKQMARLSGKEPLGSLAMARLLGLSRGRLERARRFAADLIPAP